jgi:pyruvate dehydrogenase E1 component alpha subunit
MSEPQKHEQDQCESVATFDIRFTRYIDNEGTAVGTLPDIARDPEALIPLYRAMVLNRVFDKKAVALQRTGKLGTYASSLGQEAVFAAVGAVMEQRDVLVPYYRECGTQLLRGVTMTELLLYWGGDERGMDYAGPREDLPICVPIASQIPHAAGVALAMKYRQEPRVTVTMFGDGATSKGDFYEAANAAGVWNLPLVFVVNNNQWAISVPLHEQTGCQTLAQKAIAAGFPGEQVDGNDLIAVFDRFSAALEKARTGGGPTLIEAITYRLSDHTTADDATRYRSDEELRTSWEHEPIKRLRQFLITAGYWDQQRDEQLHAACEREVEQATQAYLDTPPPEPESMFDYLYAQLPAALQPQREELSNKVKRACRS